MNYNYELSISIATEREMEKTLLWYRETRWGLEENFRLCMNAALQKITRNPLQYAIITGDIRKVRVQHFPFSIFYRLKGSAVRVIGLIHDKRNPMVWNGR
jgi:hypothetical protein